MVNRWSKLIAVLAVTSLLSACGGSSNSSSGALSGTDWTVTKYFLVDTTACGWQMSFDIAGNYLETRTSDCGVVMNPGAPCMLSGTYSGDTGATFLRTITTDTCFIGPGSSVGTETLGYSINTAPMPDVITVIRGATTIIMADKN